MSKYVSLDLILGKSDEELQMLPEGEYTTEKLGVIPYTAINHKEYTKAKKACMSMVKKDKAYMPDLDDDKLMLKVIVAAVDKDKRSDFTFANAQLLSKLKVVSAEQAVQELLSPGEIYGMAVEVQSLSGFGAEAESEMEEDIKN